MIPVQNDNVDGLDNIPAKTFKIFAVVAKSCTAALAPKNIEAAVRKVSDKEDRTRNVIIYGVEEQENEKLKQKVENILEEIGEKPVDFGRVGVKRSDIKASRSIKFTLSNSDYVKEVLRSGRRLHSKD
ncbi:hypothetical protein ACHWQZ_G002986 [Mnemiopsis leidyi]